MRIITGSARGAVLTTLEGEATRPTSSKVKEAIFSSIQFDIEGRRFLDLFAGSGQMGLEALSRGAEKAVMVDNSREAIEIMKANAQKTHLYQKTSILCMDFQQYIRSARGKIQFDIVFLDPPYALRLIPEAACALYDAGLRVPEDVSVLGYDDLTIATRVRPALTTVHQPIDAFVQRSLELFSQPSQALHAEILLPHSIVERQSCRRVGDPVPKPV